MSDAALSVRLRCSTWPQLLALYRHDISRGQVFLRSKSAPKPGTKLRIDLILPSGGSVELSGVVSVVLGNDSSRGAGAVVALDALAPSHRLTLMTAIRAYEEKSKRETARREPIKMDQSTTDTMSLDEGKALGLAATELAAALKSELATFEKLNPFQMLGIGYSAEDDNVRAAFGELSKRYHPDRFVRYQSSEISELAQTLFMRARDAYKATATAVDRAALAEQIRRERVPRSPAVPPAVNVTGRTRQAKPTQPARPTAARRKKGDTVRPPLQSGDGATEQAPPVSALAAGSQLEQSSELDPLVAYPDAQPLIAGRRFTDASGLFNLAARRDVQSVAARAGIELAEGFRALESGDRMEAAQRFEAVLDLHPANEVAARELAKMRRRASSQRQGVLAKLMKDGSQWP